MLPVTIGAFNGARSSEAGAGLVGAQHGARAGCACSGTRGAERHAGAAQRCAHCARAFFYPADLVGTDRGAEGFGYLIGFTGANGNYDAMYAVVLTVRFWALPLTAFICRSPGGRSHGATEPSHCGWRAAGWPAGEDRKVAYRLLWGFAHIFSILALRLPGEILARSGTFTPFQLPALSAVLERIWSDATYGDLWINTGLTLYRALVAFAICAVLGVLIGMAMSRNVIANWFFDPIVSVGFPMPKIAFLPVVILWLGVYDVSKITIIVIDAIFPVIAATVIAIQGVERELIWSARNMGANNRELLYQIILPAASPQIMTGLQVALPLSLIVAVVAEMLMGGYGLGGAMITASRFANSTSVFAGILEIAVVGYVLVKVMSLIRRRVLIWHQEAHAPSTA
jgi:ABC-type nitrate/sulfonate/bicarbonate transport system permease component